GGGGGGDLPIYPPEKLLQAEYDTIIVGSTNGIESIPQQLADMGIKSKINTSYVDFPVKARQIFLENLGELINAKALSGNVAEGGVFQGDFAKHISRIFSDKTLYLLDTFEGLDKRDTDIETANDYSHFGAGHFGIGSEDIVLAKVPHPEKCVIKKGYFPETTAGLEDEQFCFVNLDFDLYQPTLAGLEFFAPRMVKGGVILIHEYFSENYKGVKQAVTEFANQTNRQYFPIGDGISVGFQF
ncbi:MAG: TylF/MycF family methyltransferase, partial [Defluviitaleaceae bacterium]|nr:TylF/MycF family methyltransferase [Defluviitaleaceae bacterium]